MEMILEAWSRVSMILVGVVGMTGMASWSGAQGGPDADWDLVFDTDAIVRVGDYRLPPGDYWLEQADMDADIFVLYDEDDPARANPIAMVDVWRVPVPRIAEAEAEVAIRYDPDEQKMPILEGWMIDGQRWKVRDVVAADEQSVLTMIFSG